MCTSGDTADVAQSGERKTEDLKVASSILAIRMVIFWTDFRFWLFCEAPPKNLIFLLILNFYYFFTQKLGGTPQLQKKNSCETRNGIDNFPRIAWLFRSGSKLEQWSVHWNVHAYLQYDTPPLPSPLHHFLTFSCFAHTCPPKPTNKPMMPSKTWRKSRRKCAQLPLISFLLCANIAPRGLAQTWSPPKAPK